MIAQAVMFGFNIGEISCPTKYFEGASSINFRRSVEYGLGLLATTAPFVARNAGIIHSPLFGARGRKITRQYYAHLQQGSWRLFAILVHRAPPAAESSGAAARPGPKMTVNSKQPCKRTRA